jgi:hypothetical protein
MVDKVKNQRSEDVYALGIYLNEAVENEEPYDARVSRTDL